MRGERKRHRETHRQTETNRQRDRGRYKERQTETERKKLAVQGDDKTQPVALGVRCTYGLQRIKTRNPKLLLGFTPSWMPHIVTC